jgi:Isopropylmalate/homocitrate/citramalate synthases
MVSNFTGMPVQPNKAIVGKNAFAHESGIHQDGLIKERTTYEIMDAKSIGLKNNSLVLGKHSGRHAFKEYLNASGYKVDEDTFEKLFNKFKNLADKKKNLSNADIDALISDEIYKVEDYYVLDYVSVNTGNTVLPTATIKIKVGDQVIQKAACSGDGPIDAIFKTINEVVDIPSISLVSYKIEAITEGTDALGEAIVKLKIEDEIYTGRSVESDVTLLVV